MASTVLTLIQSFCRLQGLPVPGTVANSSDPQVNQLLETLQSACEELLTYPWEFLKRVKTFSSIASESQGTIESLTGSDFLEIIEDTIWDLTTRRPIYGPQSEREAQQARALISGAAFYRHRIEQGQLFIWPTPAAGHSFTFYWRSNQFVLSRTAVKQSRILADDDTLYFPDLLAKQVLRAKWLQVKGLPGWQAEQEQAKAEAARLSASGRTSKTLSLDGVSGMVPPGVLVPLGVYTAT